MKIINDSIIKNEILDKEVLSKIISDSDVEHSNKIGLLKILERNSNPTKINKEIYELNYDIEQGKKYEKSQRKYRNQEDNAQLYEDFKKFENYVYSLISTKDYQSRVSKTKEKVKLLDIHNIFGYDREQRHKDLVQEGKFYLWEGLKKYGVLPEKEKHFKDATKKRSIASKSTFVHTNLENSLINLGKKASSEKFKAILTELKPETFEGTDDQ